MTTVLAMPDWLIVMRTGDWIFVSEQVARNVRQLIDNPNLKFVDVSPAKKINIMDISEIMDAPSAGQYLTGKGVYRCSHGIIHKHEERCQCGQTVTIDAIVETFNLPPLSKEERLANIKRIQEIKNGIRRQHGWIEKNYDQPEGQTGQAVEG